MFDFKSKLKMLLNNRYLVFTIKKIIHLCKTNIHTSSRNNVSLKSYPELYHSKHENHLQEIIKSMYLVPDFINEKEENDLLDEAEKIFTQKRIRFEQSHWDDAIHNYRETEHLNWNNQNQNIIERIRRTAFSENTNHIKYVHILEIAKDGFIKPHVDSIRVNHGFIK